MKVGLPPKSTNGSKVPKEAMRIGLPQRGTWINFLKQTKECKRLGHKKESLGLEHNCQKADGVESWTRKECHNMGPLLSQLASLRWISNLWWSLHRYHYPWTTSHRHDYLMVFRFQRPQNPLTQKGVMPLEYRSRPSSRKVHWRLSVATTWTS